MTASTPTPPRSPTGCLYLLLMIVVLLFVLNQPAAIEDDN